MTENEDHLTPHIGLEKVHGVPLAYQRSVLRTDPDRLADTLKEIEDIQQAPESTVKGLTVKRHSQMEPGYLELTGSDVDAKDVLDQLRTALATKGLSAPLELEPVCLADDPDPLVGMPVKHGHGTTREGIYLTGFEPPARSVSDPAAGRRPVVAVLDTQVREHPWLGDGEADDPFWQDARNAPDAWVPDFDVPDESGDGQLTHAGHGTFIAGIVRLLAPDARVLSVPVMHGNGAVEEGHVIKALRWLHDRVTSEFDDRPDQFVDVVNLSFGRYLLDEYPIDTAELSTVLTDLAEIGVQVVASAGNQPVETEVFPAVLSKETAAPGQPGLVSVGARDPDGTPADYTSTGDWVTVMAPGTAVVSTLPKFFHAVWPPPDDGDGLEKILPDPNFQASRIGQWSGTSFAAAWVSASIAAKLLEQAAPGSLVDNSPTAAGARASSALDAVMADLEVWTTSHGVVD
jgi:Subtilase family